MLSPRRKKMLELFSRFDAPIPMSKVRQEYTLEPNDESTRIFQDPYNMATIGLLAREKIAGTNHFMITEKGRDALRESLSLPLSYPEKPEQPQESLLSEAEKVADAVGLMLRRNTEYRNGLIQIQNIIDELLKQ